MPFLWTSPSLLTRNTGTEGHKVSCEWSNYNSRREVNSNPKLKATWIQTPTLKWQTAGLQLLELAGHCDVYQNWACIEL